MREDMTQWAPKYSDTQRRAVEYAYLDKAIRPATEIARLAKRGELVFEGRKVPAFEIPYGTVLDIGKAEEKRRTGRAHSQLVNQPHPTAVEQLRRRLVSLLDHETIRLEREQRKHSKQPADAEQLRKVGRALRELASLPEPSAGRAPRPGATARSGAPTGESPAKENSMAGSIQAAMRGEGYGDAARGGREREASDDGERGDGTTEGDGDAANAARDTDESERVEGGDGAPGAYARGAFAGLEVERVDVLPRR